MKFPKLLILAFSVVAMLSCQKSGPKEIALGKDQCDNCRMTISQLGYATELITEKGRAYKFDDIMCMTMYENSNPDKAKNAKLYVVDYPSGKFLEKAKATLIKGGKIKSPMGGNTQAYQTRAAAEKAAANMGASLTK
jgi:copper chaperone NosL